MAGASRLSVLLGSCDLVKDYKTWAMHESMVAYCVRCVIADKASEALEPRSRTAAFAFGTAGAAS